MSNKDFKKNLTILGNKVTSPNSPTDALIEIVSNHYPDQNYLARFTCPEFTSLCPVTNQPDFARIIIDYIPNLNLIESKSLKLFLQSFRNHPSFHESCTMQIANTLIKKAQPKWFRICSYWYPRGGIPIDVFFQTGEPPKGVWIEPITIGTFSGR